MTICQVIDKLSVALYSAIFERKGKNDGYFQLWLVSLAFCQLQIRHRDEIVRKDHLFELIITTRFKKTFQLRAWLQIYMYRTV